MFPLYKSLGLSFHDIWMKERHSSILELLLQLKIFLLPNFLMGRQMYVGRERLVLEAESQENSDNLFTIWISNEDAVFFSSLTGKIWGNKKFYYHQCNDTKHINLHSVWRWWDDLIRNHWTNSSCFIYRSHKYYSNRFFPWNLSSV